MMVVGRNALYFEDYVLSIQYFNQIANAKPYMYEPYFYRAIAKLSLEDYIGAEEDCNSSIERNPFVVDSYQVRGLSLIYQGKFDEAMAMIGENVELIPLFNDDDRLYSEEEILSMVGIWSNIQKMWNEVMRVDSIQLHTNAVNVYAY
jgi:tetratricopeptide (TPR) repeat protein